MTHLDGVKDETAARLYHTRSYMVNGGHGNDKTVPIEFRSISQSCTNIFTVSECNKIQQVLMQNI